MEYKEILTKLKNKEINCEQALENLAEIGASPNLLHDDNGHWAVAFDGFQNVPMSDKPEDISTTCFVEAENWKDSIYEALVWAMSKDDDE